MCGGGSSGSSGKMNFGNGAPLGMSLSGAPRANYGVQPSYGQQNNMMPGSYYNHASYNPNSDYNSTLNHPEYNNNSSPSQSGPTAMLPPPLPNPVMTTMTPGSSTAMPPVQNYWGDLESQWQKFSANPNQWAPGTDMNAAKQAFMNAGGYDTVGDPVANGVPFQAATSPGAMTTTPAAPIHLTDKPHKMTGEYVPHGWYKHGHMDELRAWEAANPELYAAWKRNH